MYQNLKRLNRLEMLSEIIPPKNWIPSRSGGPRKIIRKEMVLSEDEKKIKEGLE